MKKHILKNAAINAVGTALYIVAVASFLFHAPDIFGKDGPKTVLIPIMMLMLFVFSAAVTSVLMFGRTIMWYFDGRKKEALYLLGGTLGVFLIITLIAFFALFFYLGQQPPITINN